MAKDDKEKTQQLPAVKVEDLKTKTNPENVVSAFAMSIDHLMNQAYQQSQVEGEHQQKFADWCNHLGDLWREVKQHV